MQTLGEPSNNRVRGTTCTVDITCGYIPGLKTQGAFTYHKDFHIVARIILVKSF